VLSSNTFVSRDVSVLISSWTSLQIFQSSLLPLQIKVTRGDSLVDTTFFTIMDPVIIIRGPSISVGIATDYGLEGLGSNPGGDEIFRPPRPALGPTQPPVKWVPALSRRKVRPGRAADHSPPSGAPVIEEYSYTSTHPLDHTGPVTGSLYLHLLLLMFTI